MSIMLKIHKSITMILFDWERDFSSQHYLTLPTRKIEGKNYDYTEKK